MAGAVMLAPVLPPKTIQPGDAAHNHLDAIERCGVYHVDLFLYFFQIWEDV